MKVHETDEKLSLLKTYLKLSYNFILFTWNFPPINLLTHTLFQAAQDEKASLEAELQTLKKIEEEKIKAKCAEVFE